MELQSASSGASSLEIKSLQLAKSQQETEGQATLQLLESAADVPRSASSDLAVGSNIDTFA